MEKKYIGQNFEIILDDIERALKAECFFSALALALTLPDVCGKALYPKTERVGERYIKWCDEYLHCECQNDIGGKIIYNLRNSFLHQSSPHVKNYKLCDVNWLKEQEQEIEIDYNKSGFTIKFSKATGIYTEEYVIQQYDNERAVFNCKINGTGLCEHLISVARKCYRENKNKFEFVYSDIIVEE